MTVFVCNIGWMARYHGQEKQPDIIVGGGKYVDENGEGGEVCNFEPSVDKMVYGHVETIKGKRDRELEIERIGAEPGAPAAYGVDVVWVATNPKSGGRFVVGWYRNATVFRTRQYNRRYPSVQHRYDGLKGYRISALAKDATLLDLDERESFPLGRGSGWIGHANWWYPEESKNPEALVFLRSIRRAMQSSLRKPARVSRRGGWGKNTDAEHRVKVEAAAREIVWSHYAPPYKIKSVEKDNAGWDLEIRRKGKVIFAVEVKGLSGQEATIGLTPNEYRAFSAHCAGKKNEYRLAIVTSALTAPKLRILFYDVKKRSWVDEVRGKPAVVEINEILSAIVSERGSK